MGNRYDFELTGLIQSYSISYLFDAEIIAETLQLFIR